MPSLVEVWQTAPIAVSVLAVVLAAAGGWVLYLLASKTWKALHHGWQQGSGAGPFYVVAAMAMALSANTSWRFFGHQLGITHTAERIAMFAVLEVAFIACAYAMRANIRGPRKEPGAPRMVVWLLSAVAAYMAVTESGLTSGIARVALGPVLGIAALHFALGIELRQVTSEASGTLTRITAEVRERLLSRLGLADDSRPARVRTQDRAARRAARLAMAPRTRLRDVRLHRALRASGVAHDAAMRDRMLDELAMVQHAQGLADLTQPSPWVRDTDLGHPAVSHAGAPSGVEASPSVLPDHGPTTAPDVATTDTADPAHGRDLVGSTPTTLTTLPDHESDQKSDQPDHAETTQHEDAVLAPAAADTDSVADHGNSAEPDHGREPRPPAEDGRPDTQILPVSTAVQNAKPPASAESGEPVTQADHARTTVPTQHTGPPTAPTPGPGSTHPTTPSPTESDHGRASSSMVGAWSGGSPVSALAGRDLDRDSPTTGTAAHASEHREPDHAQASDRDTHGRYGTRIPTKGLAQADIAERMMPIATALVDEGDFLSREDLKELTEITSSHTASEVLALIRTGASHTGDGSELPKPRSRRADRHRTICRELNAISQQPHIKAVR